MMLGLHGSTSPTKVFRCVACSATFTGLAALLVHQATHANALSKAPTPPQSDSSPHETLLSSMDSPTEQPSPSKALPESPSPSFYICDCGEEFQDFHLMLKHEQLHVCNSQQMDPPDDTSPSNRTECKKGLPDQSLSDSPTINQTGLAISCPSTSRPPPEEQAPSSGSKADTSFEDGIGIVTPSQGQYTPPLDENEEQPEDILAETEPLLETMEDIYSEEMTNSVYTSEDRENLPNKNALMKVLASAYMRCSPTPSPDQDESMIIPKQEADAFEITPEPRAEVAPTSDTSVAQLRRLLAVPGVKTKAPSISKVLGFSKKRVVSLTKTFSPVVVLETRQKLKDPGGNSTYGRYQCGRCRRVFDNVDRLTEHHFLHKKERIKCCRRCKQLIIGRVPLNDNHVCPQMGNKPTQFSSSFKNKLPAVPLHSQNNARKVFFCPLCKHSYARRWNLKMHKCQGPRAAPPEPTTFSSQKMFSLRSNSITSGDAEIEFGSNVAKSIAVGTEVMSCIKEEVTSLDVDQSAVSQLAWVQPAKSFLPFYPKTSLKEQSDFAALHGISLQQGKENSGWGAAVDDGEDGGEGQWTMPLDDEMEVLSSAEKNVTGAEEKKPLPDEHAQRAPTGLRYFVKDGIKRYPCTRCHKTYSRSCTLRRHLRLCGFRPRLPGTVAQSGSLGAKLPNANPSVPLFPCFVCGRSFNRKDNMMVHRKKCILRRTMSEAAGVTVQQSAAANAVASAVANAAASAADCQTQADDVNNWGVMSLPSVLPRRVTCECGVGFTSPRLLLEHLQKHAQESYTCPTCGETVSSWADYEVHLKIHMHPHHQLLKGIQPQRSQPLLIRFQQAPQQQLPQPVQHPSPPVRHPSPPVQQPASNQTVKVVQLQNPSLKNQRHVCTRCNNTFASRCSLRRHLTWNRCKGVRPTNPPSNPSKDYHCSHCNSDFPNSISLVFHQRSGSCKPAIKPVRCPVCLRWFGTVDSLQKHLLTHKQSESNRCDVCQGIFSSLKSLQNHRRKIHRIFVGGTKEQIAT